MCSSDLFPSHDTSHEQTSLQQHQSHTQQSTSKSTSSSHTSHSNNTTTTTDQQSPQRQSQQELLSQDELKQLELDSFCKRAESLFPYDITLDNLPVWRAFLFLLETLPPIHLCRLFRHSHCSYPIYPNTYNNDDDDCDVNQQQKQQQQQSVQVKNEISMK